jgi:hypothetical protein
MTETNRRTEASFSNRLQHEKSPYLLQHAHNPVDWYPWGDDAFNRAKAENRPIFLSIGYATCHWCHVMEKESFEDQTVADLLNRDYICIKVDREERPDIDQVFMDVCVRLTKSGGWPLTIFLTPDKKPFFAGTYFPKESHPGRPGLIDYLPLIATRWRERPEEFQQRAVQIIDELQASAQKQGMAESITTDIFARATGQLQQRFDATHGGFGTAPKFPSPHNLAYLLRRYRRTGNKKLLEMVTTTLHAMRNGGMYDQIGFGFHRYSTDRQWLVPHFEKMLYDQAGLAQVYLETYQVTHEQSFAQAAREIFTYVRRDLTGDQGGFFSAQDADSEGEEGKFYLWDIDEINSTLGKKQGGFYCEVFNLTEAGNYRDESSQELTGRNIPHLTQRLEQIAANLDKTVDQLAEQIEACREKLFTQRALRIAPLTDDKIITAWNGMMISALAAGGRILNDGSYIAAAETAANFILTRLRTNEGKLLRRYRDGEAAIDAFAEDYAFFAKGLLDLYRATFNPQQLQQSIDLAGQLADQFMDAEIGLIYETNSSNCELFLRPKNLFDGAHPSTNSIALQLFTRLNRLTGEPVWKERSDALLAGLAPSIQAYPTGFTSALQSVALQLEPTREIVFTGKTESEELKRLVRISNGIFAPETTTLLRPDRDNQTIIQLAPFTQQMNSLKYPAAAYICQNFACLSPITKAEKLTEILTKTA